MSAAVGTTAAVLNPAMGNPLVVGAALHRVGGGLGDSLAVIVEAFTKAGGF